MIMKHIAPESWRALELESSRVLHQGRGSASLLCFRQVEPFAVLNTRAPSLTCFAHVPLCFVLLLFKVDRPWVRAQRVGHSRLQRPALHLSTLPGCSSSRSPGEGRGCESQDGRWEQSGEPIPKTTTGIVTIVCSHLL